MTLILRATRDKVTFEWDDEEVFTSVTIKSDETDEAMVRKLKRVIALVEGETGSSWVEQTMASRLKPGPLAVFGTGEPPVGNGVPGPVTNGWAVPVAAPELPEDRQGDYEIIRPGEDV
ncbi:hypothetical protein ACIOHE_26310 [Streptomyces sp. NPDC087851]|uniref:hypothetical protein n=1 Tax=Streptomyces sp. NPDC087851 TaxID=3365810 RepID=UPI0038246ECA